MGEDRDRTKIDSLSLTCPVCGTFIIGMEAVSFGYERRRTDFRPQYTGDNPMKLYHHICPQCKFCAEEDYYSLELGKEQKAQLRDRLEALHKKHGINIEGEGGEYETLVLSGPTHKKRIVLDGVEKVWLRDSGRLRITGMHLA